jgi:cyclic beta-1,2-glucan synthetase
VRTGDQSTLLQIKYVITLDSDTQLPRDAARRLIGTISHPLNRPRFCARVGRVTKGYGILQPRVSISLTSAARSRFARVFSGNTGVDPYTTAVSDVYQDLFGEGSYAGKGLYDVDAFEAALAGRAPENALLSHDLFEGLFARAGLVSDIELFEGFPAHFEVAAARQHRWARGDWQLLAWILGIAREASGRRRRGAIPAIGRWKMLDNLRRTLSAPASFLTLLASWALPGTSPALWTSFILATIALPGLFNVFAGLLPRRRGISKRSFLRGLGNDIVLAVSQASLTAAFLAHQAYLAADAIARTLFRLIGTRRHLLEWVTAAQSQSGLDLRLSGFYRRMGRGVAVDDCAPRRSFFFKAHIDFFGEIAKYRGARRIWARGTWRSPRRSRCER